MTSAHTSLRALVAHLARAQRAFDAGSLDEAEGAIADALAIDPHNVQAADLRQRIAKLRPPADSPPPQPSRRPVAPAPGAARIPAPRLSAAAWSTFEQRVRERRADRAVADAQEALARGDVDAAEAAVSELGEVAPDDPRRGWLLRSVEAQAAEPAVIAATSRVAHPAPPRHDDLPLLPPEPGAAWPIELRPPLADPVVHRRSRSRPAVVGLGAVAASGLLGFWLFTSRLPDPVATTPAGQQRDVQQPDTEAPVASAAEDPSPLGTGGQEMVGPGLDVPLTAAPEDPALSQAGDDPGAVAPAETPEAREAPAQSPLNDAPASRNPTAPPLTASKTPIDTPVPPPVASARVPAPTDRVPAPAAANPTEMARMEPTPTPLDAPVQSPITPPEMRRAGDPRGGEPAAPAMTPVPVPPPAAAAATPAPVSRAAGDVSAVRAVIDGYAEAFNTLDASATQRVWPGVDQRALRRAFEQLSAQSIAFNHCEVNPSGDTAEAVCVGRATWVPKVGDRSPKSEPRTWRFAMGRDQGEWVIDRVQVQR